MVPSGESRRRVQYAALPYRVRQDGEVQIRLITSRETRRWVIPKGWPMKNLSPPKAAAREAYEEAGLFGAIAREAIGMYTYEKRLATRSVLCDVLVFPFKVKRYVQNWPERSQRFGFWFTVESAAAAVLEEELKALILAFGDLMEKKRAAKARKAQEAAEAAAAKASGKAGGKAAGKAVAPEGSAAKGDQAAEQAPAPAQGDAEPAKSRSASKKKGAADRAAARDPAEAKPAKSAKSAARSETDGDADASRDAPSPAQPSPPKR